MNDDKPDQVVDPDVAAGETALNWALMRGSGERIAARSRAQRCRKQQLRRFVAGSLTIGILITAGFLWHLRSPSRSSTPTQLRSSVVVVKPATQLLPDGSVVELKDGAKIDVYYSADGRRVRLIRGEVHLAVVKNLAVPFIVIVGDLEVRAIGTAFSVQLDARRVEVLVTEGRVALEKPINTRAGAADNPLQGVSPGRQTLATVDAGNRVVVESTTAPARPPVLAVSEAERDESLSWRVPRIELSGTPLSEALPVFNRYSPIKLSLADPSLGTIELSGVLRPNNPNALLHVLKTEFGLEVDGRADGEIVLHRP